MDNTIYSQYFINQQGSGIGGFQGLRTQKGYGFFSKLYSNVILPIGKWLGKKSLQTATNVASDVLAGKDFKESIKERGIESAKDVGTTALSKARDYVTQTGSGKKRKTAIKRPVKTKKRKISKLPKFLN